MTLDNIIQKSKRTIVISSIALSLAVASLNGCALHRYDISEESSMPILRANNYTNKSKVSDDALKFSIVNYIYNKLPDKQSNYIFAHWGRFVHRINGIEELTILSDNNIFQEGNLKKNIEAYDSFHVSDGKSFDYVLSIVEPGYKVGGEFVQEPVVIIQDLMH